MNSLEVFQADVSISFLIRVNGEFQHIMVVLPSLLRVVDRVTTETTKQYAEDLLLVILELADLLAQFLYVVHLTCNDRGPANGAAEKAFEIAKSLGVSRLRTTCSIHKTHLPGLTVRL